MRLSRESEYGLEALRVLAAQPPGVVMLVRDIATAGGLPESFLSKIFQKLRRHGVALAHRGAVRGYSLAKPPSAISVREVLEAIEGPGLFDRCVFWQARCDPQRLCCLHSRWARVRPELRRLLEGTTLEQFDSTPRRSGRRQQLEGRARPNGRAETRTVSLRTT